MVAGLDLPLDDLVRANKRSSRGRRRRAPGRFAPNRYTFRRGASSSSGKGAAIWLKGMQYHAAPERTMEVEIGTKLFISNLDYGVSNDDINELFSSVGGLKRFSVHFDKSGRSEGTAEVVFSRRIDALSAVKRYNKVHLDGKPMKIEIVGSNILKPVKGAASSMAYNIKAFPQRLNKTRGFGRGGRHLVQVGRRRKGRGRGRDRARRDPVSAEDLDADLEKYFLQSFKSVEIIP